ncbi:D-alanyl-D-alanine carboxypeptidase [Paludibacterium denitrificans]|uniref:D-alanyl-D-alanine carboxypeptidase n=1 Tax=Paludibacterium denitrificans TaxID=2675226 RepID=UPI0028AAF6A5|nr:D-alanyl-D-alanine carboxypeptidase [Paludibacterium denitrificans]
MPNTPCGARWPKTISPTNRWCWKMAQTACRGVNGYRRTCWVRSCSIAHVARMLGEFIASLPIASTDGTLKKRFKDVGPRLRLKTGTLSNVKALAGYWQAPDGRRLALVAIVNSPRALAMGKALDQVVDDVIERFASAAP